MMKKIAEKILKYKGLTKEMQRMWNVQTEVIPVIIGVRENNYKSITKYLQQHTGKARHEARATKHSCNRQCTNTVGKY